MVGLEHEFGAEGASECTALRNEITGDDVDSLQGKQAGKHEADGTLANDEGVITGKKIEAMNGLEGGIDGLEHGAFVKGVAGGNSDDTGEDKGHDTHILGVAAPGGLEAGGDAGFLVLGTLGKGTMAASMTLHAGNVMMEANPIAELEAAHARAEF